LDEVLNQEELIFEKPPNQPSIGISQRHLLIN
jgi:hypothetical protein